MVARTRMGTGPEHWYRRIDNELHEFFPSSFQDFIRKWIPLSLFIGIAVGLMTVLFQLALVAVGAPSVASYLRLVPSHWAGAYQCWGKENREAAIRLVNGSAGEQAIRANLEVKCFDLAANPYLVIGSLFATGLSGISAGAVLPAETEGDPVALPESELAERGIRRLPQSLGEAVGALEGCDVLREAMGEPRFEAFLAVRRAEIALFVCRHSGRQHGNCPRSRRHRPGQRGVGAEGALRVGVGDEEIVVGVAGQDRGRVPSLTIRPTTTLTGRQKHWRNGSTTLWRRSARPSRSNRSTPTVR